MIWVTRKVKMKEFLIVFCIGAVGYSLLEILWRGFTHWTMALTGGICFWFIYSICMRYPNMPLLGKCLWGALVITAVEFIVGCIVNRGLHMQVWDYSNQPLNLYGQICLTYSALWFLLCIPITYLSQGIKKFIF